MTTAKQGASGGGMLSKLAIVLLLAVTIGLYLRIVMVEGPATQSRAAAPQASVQVTEGYAASPQANAAVLQDLPEDQMQLIIQVFAPELQQN